MSTTAIPLSAKGSKAVRVILWAGLIAGILDITGACVVAWLRGSTTPVAVFKYIASGIYGRAAFTSGTKMAVIGLILHFFIATTWATVYYHASQRIKFLINQPIIAGVLYGILVFLFMNFVVLPLSAVAKRPVPLSSRVIGMLVIILCIGLPIAFVVRRLSK